MLPSTLPLDGLGSRLPKGRLERANVRLCLTHRHSAHKYGTIPANALL